MGDSALHVILPRVTGEIETKKYTNFLLGLHERRQRHDRIVAKPIDTTIDLTTTCQLNCPYCAVGNRTMSRSVSLMNESMFSHLMTELGDTTFISWYFSTGEPLLHKKFGQLLSTSKEKQIFGVISTNLSLPLSDDRITDIIDCGLGMISISLDGASEKTYSQYRVGGKFDLVVDNIRRLVARKRELGLQFPLIEWRFLLFEHNQHEVAVAKAMALELGVDLLEFYPGYAPDQAEDSAVRKMTIPMPDPSVMGPALSLATARQDTTLRRVLAKRSFPAPEQRPFVAKCDWLYYSGMIYPNGSFGPCCVATNEEDDFCNLGDHATFLDAWNSDKFVASRRAFREGGKAGTVCDRCPLPPAQHYQFVQKVRGILWNAPDWVLKVLNRNMERYLFDVDETFLTQEMGAIRSLKSFEPPDRDVADEITRYARSGNIDDTLIRPILASL